jgi:hypothetical protein
MGAVQGLLSFIFFLILFPPRPLFFLLFLPLPFLFLIFLLLLPCLFFCSGVSIGTDRHRSGSGKFCLTADKDVEVASEQTLWEEEREVFGGHFPRLGLDGPAGIRDVTEGHTIRQLATICLRSRAPGLGFVAEDDRKGQKEGTTAVSQKGAVVEYGEFGKGVKVAQQATKSRSQLTSMR